jgi:hypothetical protein
VGTSPKAALLSKKAGEDMAQSNASLQLELITGARARRDGMRQARNQLLCRSFFDGSSDVSVVGLCPTNPSHVMLERRADGRRWTAPSSLMRHILGRGRRF